MPNATDGHVVVNARVRIPMSELRFVFSRSPGPGGQNVNKLNTQATLLFDLAATQSLTAVQRSRVRRRLHPPPGDRTHARTERRGRIDVGHH